MLGGNVSNQSAEQTHTRENDHSHEHGHTHEAMESPGMWTERDKPVTRGDWQQVSNGSLKILVLKSQHTDFVWVYKIISPQSDSEGLSLGTPVFSLEIDCHAKIKL